MGAKLSKSLVCLETSLNWMLGQEDFNERLAGALLFSFWVNLGGNYLIKEHLKHVPQIENHWPNSV